MSAASATRGCGDKYRCKPDAWESLEGCWSMLCYARLDHESKVSQSILPAGMKLIKGRVSTVSGPWLQTAMQTGSRSWGWWRS